MKLKVFLQLSLIILLLSTHSFDQKQLSDSEIQNFFTLIKQTKEFKSLKIKTDSINATKKPDEVHEDIDVHLVKKMSGAPQDDYIYPAVIERMLIGMVLERYNIDYDQQKKKLVAIKKEQVRLKIN